MHSRHKTYLRIRQYVDLSLRNTNLAGYISTAPVLFPDNNLLWYEVKIWFTVDKSRVKNDPWQLIHCNSEIFWVGYFFSKHVVCITVLIQWLQLGYYASLETRNLQPTEQLKSYQMAMTYGNCFRIHKACFAFTNPLRYLLSIQQKYAFKNVSQSVSCTGYWVGLFSIFRLYITR